MSKQLPEIKGSDGFWVGNDATVGRVRQLRAKLQAYRQLLSEGMDAIEFLEEELHRYKLLARKWRRKARGY